MGYISIAFVTQEQGARLESIPGQWIWKCLQPIRQHERRKIKKVQAESNLGHPGWEELIAIKLVFPDVPILHQLEFVYQLTGADRALIQVRGRSDGIK